jgi:hypothetical protein
MLWPQDGVCLGVDYDISAGTGSRPDPSTVFAAGLLCTDCPMFELCGQYATEHGLYGMWAGAWRYHQTGTGYQVRPLIPRAETQVAA